MSVPPYTPAQLRAIEWLPADGSIRIEIGRMHPRILDALVLLRQKTDLVHGDLRRKHVNFSLTPFGISERARLVEEGVIK